MEEDRIGGGEELCEGGEEKKRKHASCVKEVKKGRGKARVV